MIAGWFQGLWKTWVNQSSQIMVKINHASNYQPVYMSCERDNVWCFEQEKRYLCRLATCHGAGVVNLVGSLSQSLNVSSWRAMNKTCWAWKTDSDNRHLLATSNQKLIRTEISSLMFIVACHSQNNAILDYLFCWQLLAIATAFVVGTLHLVSNINHNITKWCYCSCIRFITQFQFSLLLEHTWAFFFTMFDHSIFT